MADAAPAPAPVAAPEPVLDLSLYTPVLIQKTGKIEGHDYRRGERHMVDAATHAALTAAGLI